MGTLLVPKGPRVESSQAEDQATSEVEQLKATLFAMPVPPEPTGTRTYPIHTTLGRIMRLRGLAVNEVAKVDGGPSARQLTEHLAGRRGLSAAHRWALAKGLGIDGRLLG